MLKAKPDNKPLVMFSNVFLDDERHFSYEKQRKGTSSEERIQLEESSIFYVFFQQAKNK